MSGSFQPPAPPEPPPGSLLPDLLLPFLGGRDAALARIAAILADPDVSARDLRSAAWAAFAVSDPERGEALLRRAARHADDAGNGWFALAAVRLGRGDDKGAYQAFIAAARARARSGGARDGVAEQLRRLPADGNRYAAFGVFYNGFDDLFTCFALLRDVRPVEQQHYGFCFDRAMTVLGRSPSATALLDAERARNGEHFWYHVNLGHRFWVDGARDEADAHYAAARDEVLGKRITPFHFNCGIIVWLSRARAAALLDAPGADAARPGWTWHEAPPGANPSGAILVGFDPGYFVFFPKFLLSAVAAYKASGTDIPFRIHCHIADAPHDMVAFVLQIAHAITAHVPTLSLSISTGPSTCAEPAHFTCLRYLALPDLMRRLGCGVVAMDVDAEILPTFFGNWPLVAAHPFGLRMYSFNLEGEQVGGEPWSIGAHPTYIADTPLGRRFAGFLRDYIDAAYDPSLITNWTVDQCAIARGYDLLLRDLPFDTVYNFARGEPFYRLPNDYGTKQDFLNSDPVWPQTLRGRIDALFADRSA